MPIKGRFYTSAELQEILKVSRQRINNLARELGWTSPAPGFYDDGPVEEYLEARTRTEILRVAGWLLGDGRELVWDDSYDVECPVCGGFAVQRPPAPAEMREWATAEEWPWRCQNGHNG